MSTTRVRQEIERGQALRTAQPIATVALTTSAQTLVTARDDADFLVVNLWVANITGSAATLTLHQVPSGGSVADANAVTKGLSIAANSAPIVICGFGGHALRLSPGATLRALSGTGAALNIGGWGYDVEGGE